MNRTLLSLVLLLGAFPCAHATGIVIVQKVESAGNAGEITLQLDGDKARADLSPTVSLIIDGSTGEQVTLMHPTRKFMRVSAGEGQKLTKAVENDPIAAAAETPAEPPKLTPTGRKETVAGQEADIYTFKTGNVSATYWIVPDFPGAADILKSLEVLQKSTASGTLTTRMPSPADFPGLPVKTEIVMGDRTVTNTLVSIVKRPIDPQVFTVPENYTSAYIGGVSPPKAPMQTPAPRVP